MRSIPGHKIKKDTETLSMEKGRRVGQPGHKIARDYLLNRMNEINLKPFIGAELILSYERETLQEGYQKFYNLVGKIPGTNPSGRKPFLIGAHYDSVIDVLVLMIMQHLLLSFWLLLSTL